MSQPTASDATTAERDIPALSSLTWLALLTVSIDASLAILYSYWSDYPRGAFLCMLAIYAWRGTWFGMWSLWAVAASPWYKSGGVLASFLGLLMAATAMALAAGGMPANSDGKLTVIYGLEVAGWLLVARLFGLRIVHANVVNEQPRWQWSMRSLAVVLTIASVIFWIAGIVWRYEQYAPGARRIVYMGFERQFILWSMAISFGHVTALGLVLMTAGGRYAASIVGPVALAVVLWFDFSRETSWAIGEIGMTLVACVIFRERMEQDGWRIHFELPFWEQGVAASRAIPSHPSDRMTA